MDPKDLRKRFMEQQVMQSELCHFFTNEGQHVILGYYVEYFFEVFVAYNVLRKEAGLRVCVCYLFISTFTTLVQYFRSSRSPIQLSSNILDHVEEYHFEGTCGRIKEFITLLV